MNRVLLGRGIAIAKVPAPGICVGALVGKAGLKMADIACEVGHRRVAEQADGIAKMIGSTGIRSSEAHHIIAPNAVGMLRIKS